VPAARGQITVAAGQVQFGEIRRDDRGVPTGS
jgi:hypothetical protein